LSINLLPTGRFQPFQAYNINQWGVNEAYDNQMAIGLPDNCVCRHIQGQIWPFRRKSARIFHSTYM